MVFAIMTGVFDFAVNSFILLLSGCLSLLIASGLLSGILFITVRNLGNSKKKSQLLSRGREKDSSCSCCKNKFTPFTNSFSQSCRQCTSLHCYHCSYQGTCKNCHPKSDDNFVTNLDALRSEFFEDKVASSKLSNEYHRDVEVREFMEQLIKSLVSGNLDDAPLAGVFTDKQYDLLYHKYHEKLLHILTKLSSSLHSTIDNELLEETEKPPSFYMQLKLLIREISEEAKKKLTRIVTVCKVLAVFQEQGRPLGGETGLVTGSLVASGEEQGHYVYKNCEEKAENLSIDNLTNGQCYEHILATAILHKIMSKYQDCIDSPSSNSHGVDNNNDKNRVYSDSSLMADYTSLMVEEHIEEVTTKYTSSSEEEVDKYDSTVTKFLSNVNFLTGRKAQFPELGKDIVDGVERLDEDEEFDDDEYRGIEIISPIDSWQDNWLFQKKRLRKCKSSSQHNVPVPMLVPNPSEDYRALIGDIDADETSDLSECSDSILEELIHPTTSNSYSTSTSKNIQNGVIVRKAIYENHISEQSSIIDNRSTSSLTMKSTDQESSGVASISRDISELCSTSSRSLSPSDDGSSLPWSNIAERKDNDLFHRQEDSGEGSLEGQQENEYSIHSEIHHSKICHHQTEFETASEINQTKYSTESSPTDELLFMPPKPGTIAEREHMKWEQAAPLPNNPYSKENIEKRVLDRHLPGNYTINDASLLNFDNLNENTRIECGASLPDYKMYGRDYYINTADQPTPDEKDEGTDQINKIEKNTNKIKEVDDDIEVIIVEEMKMEHNNSDTVVKKEVGTTENETVETLDKVYSKEIFEGCKNVQKELLEEQSINSNTEQEMTVEDNSSRQENSKQITNNHNKKVPVVIYENMWNTIPKVKNQAENLINVKKTNKKDLVRVSSWSERRNQEHKQRKNSPSVKELAKQFDENGQRMEKKTASQKYKQVHSLTARSMSREFREGLKTNIGRTFNRNNILSESSERSLEEHEQDHMSDDSGNVSPTSCISAITKLNEQVKF